RQRVQVEDRCAPAPHGQADRRIEVTGTWRWRVEPLVDQILETGSLEGAGHDPVAMVVQERQVRQADPILRLALSDHRLPCCLSRGGSLRHRRHPGQRRLRRWYRVRVTGAGFGARGVAYLDGRFVPMEEAN